MKKQWSAPLLEVLDVKMTMFLGDIACKFYPNLPYCQNVGGPGEADYLGS